MTEVAAAPPHILQFLTLALKEKRSMMSVDRTQGGGFDCPKCDGEVKVLLIGRKQHMRAVCQTPNCLSVME
jgi:hypothetical protein